MSSERGKLIATFHDVKASMDCNLPENDSEPGVTAFLTISTPDSIAHNVQVCAHALLSGNDWSGPVTPEDFMMFEYQHHVKYGYGEKFYKYSFWFDGKKYETVKEGLEAI
jgi:hypothetical protein